MRIGAWLLCGFALFGAPAYATGCEKPKQLWGTDVPYSLWGVCLEFTPIDRRTRVPLDSIVYFPAKEQGELTLSVERSALTQQFVEDVFDSPKKEILEAHQLAQRGVTLSLTPSRLKITVYPSVILRLRSDMLGDSTYRTFVGQPTFVVDGLSGRAYVATDLARIASAFSDVYIQYIVRMNEVASETLPDGTHRSFGTISRDGTLPSKRPPSRSSD